MVFMWVVQDKPASRRRPSNLKVVGYFTVCSEVVTSSVAWPFERPLHSGYCSQQPTSTINQHELIVPHCRRITFGRRAFSVADPTVWNSLPTEFRSLSVSFGDFRRTLSRWKQYCSHDISALSAIYFALHNIALYKFPILSFYSFFVFPRPISYRCSIDTDTLSPRDFEILRSSVSESRSGPFYTLCLKKGTPTLSTVTLERINGF